MGDKLVLITTNNKSYMSFELVPKSVTLNDPERYMAVTLCYFIEYDKLAFQHIAASARKKNNNNNNNNVAKCEVVTHPGTVISDPTIGLFTADSLKDSVLLGSPLFPGPML